MNGEEIINVIDALCAKFGIIIDWSKETMYPYLKELVKRMSLYYTVRYGLCVVLSIIMIGISISLFVTIFNANNDWKINAYVINHGSNSSFKYSYSNILFTYDGSDPVDYYLSDKGFILCVVSIGLLVSGLILMLLSVNNILRWTLIPDVCFIEYLTNVK